MDEYLHCLQRLNAKSELWWDSSLSLLAGHRQQLVGRYPRLRDYIECLLGVYQEGGNGHLTGSTTNKASGNYYYCGSNARVGLGEVTPDVCEFTYCFDQAQEYRLRVFPLTPEQLQSEIGLARFHWERAYGDFKQHYAPLEADFVVHQAHAI